jgi:SurA N-terminal domain
MNGPKVWNFEPRFRFDPVFKGRLACPAPFEIETAMYGFSRKHHKPMLIVLSTIVILSFVAYFQPGQSGFSGFSGPDYGRIYGRPLKQADFTQASALSHLGAQLRYGESAAAAAARGYDATKDMYQRLLFTEKFKQLGITVSDEEVAAWIQQNLKDSKTGKVDYEGFVEKGVRAHGYSEEQFIQLIRYEIAFSHLVDVVGVSADMVTPREAESAFRRQNQQAIASVAVFSASNYIASVTLDAGQIAQFYTNRLPNYRIPERTVVSYVKWDVTNYLAQAVTEVAKIPDLTNRIAKVYDERGASTFRDTAGNVMTREAALAYIKQQSIEGEALGRAAADAKAFANELYQIDPVKPENLAQLAAKKGLATRESAPFSENGRSLDFEDAPALTREAARLESDQPFTKPVAGTRAVYVAAVLRRLPAEVPPLDAVRPRVTEDYRRSKAADLARAAGEAFAAAAKNVGPDRPIGAIAAQEKANLVTLSPFSLESTSIPEIQGRINIATLKDVVFNLKAGTASRFTSAADGGFVAYLDQLKPVEESSIKGALNAFIEEERRERRNEVFSAWADAEMQRSGLAALFGKQGKM